ncbi:NAD(P)/FAD-dependent oxidoreductase [Pelagibaculum spongiae]|uniref:FAD-dependent oxidoreductase n=1 Tax=Pelagibaculum spongiae TaxID=2080658 RepID=A0A2V1GSP7_9GAMM|nr:FAD-dependent oxidoreductase [Pelagibaculum spongiae]PVZ66396.1 FAD-dependent oxidoreductase [Pelagibaculum spongiae]
MKIAVIGSGISGMTASWLLSKEHDVSLFEADDHLGGHTATKTVTVDNQNWEIDTGFIVFNQKTYPNFIKILNLLGIEKKPTEMGFSVSCKKTGIEYSGSGLNGLFAQKKNFLSIKFLKMIKDILKFNADATRRVNKNNISNDLTLEQYIQQQRLGDRFSNHYLLPMAAAIWSSSLEQAAKMPLDFFLKFFDNHGLLTVTDQPQWQVVSAGSHQYLKAIEKNMQAKVYLNAPVESVRRIADNSVELLVNGEKHLFDRVIMASHADQSLKILSDASEQEKALLESVPYRPSHVVLHTDTSLLPENKKAWAAWNYQLSSNNKGCATVTYNMNILQGLDQLNKKINTISSRKPMPVFCVTLNQSKQIDPTKILGQYQYSHPGFTLSGIKQRDKFSSASGSNRVWFCGAWLGNGFHEDGVVSALKALSNFGITLPDKLEPNQQEISSKINLQQTTSDKNYKVSSE